MGVMKLTNSFPCGFIVMQWQANQHMCIHMLLTTVMGLNLNCINMRGHCHKEKFDVITRILNASLWWSFVHGDKISKAFNIYRAIIFMW